MAKDDAFLFDQVAALHELVEVAAELKQVPRAPDRLHAYIGDVGVERLKIEEKLFGERRRVFFFDEVFFFVVVRRWRQWCSDQPAADEFVIEPVRSQRSPRQITRYAEGSKKRSRDLQNTFHRLQSFVGVGDAQLIDEEGPIDGMNAAEDQQLIELGRGHSQNGGIGLKGFRGW